MGLGRYEEAGRQFRRYAQINTDEGNHFYEMAEYASRNSRLRSKFAVTPVAGLNTAASDFGPAFFRNDQLVYSSSRTDAGASGSSWTGKAKNQLFLSRIKRVAGMSTLQNQYSKDSRIKRYSVIWFCFKFNIIKFNDDTRNLIAGINLADVLNRRLQSFICKLGCARSMHESRMLIMHRYIKISISL